MALNRDKFRKIVGGITTAEPERKQPHPRTRAAIRRNATAGEVAATQAGQGSNPAVANDAADSGSGERIIAGLPSVARPKGKKDDAADGKNRKVKVSLFLSEILVNDLYDWAHADRIHPGEMFERALKPFHEREAKRRNAGKE